ncbi:hypothetical protein [Longimicrobium sp.]|uniref:hypothetical protein n=1 Tax=Longimicrobium sp. TaxID=2029185 RepID=UPI002E354539|nr:hypothetical protein [Longimicrobium sp.]HEX6037402.1 hypothetical protein [Longimicrobium sp.]
MSRPAGFGVPAVQTAMPIGAPMPLVVCPRCGFQGQTVTYFSQGGHIAGLLVLTALTLFPAAGAGGLLYYLLRHNHRSCARCGHTLGKTDALALAAATQGAGGLPVAASEADLPEDVGRWSSIWGIGAIMLFMFAALMLMVAVGEGEPVALMMALFSGGGGYALTRKAQSNREERRQALVAALQQPVLRLAGQRAGRLTVTEVASSLGWPMRRAEKVLNSLEDGLRVVSDITREGVIVYEFRELMPRSRPVSADEMDSMLTTQAPAQIQPPVQHVRPGYEQAQPAPVYAQPAPAPAAAQAPLPHDGTLNA